MNNLLFLTSAAGDAAQYQKLSTAVTLFGILLGVIAIIAVVLEIIRANSHYRAQKNTLRILTVPVYLLAAVVLVLMLACSDRMKGMDPDQPSTEPTTAPTTTPTVPTDPTLPTQPTQPTLPTAPPDPTFQTAPHSTASSDPSLWNVTWEIFRGNAKLPNYTRPVSIYFTRPDAYFALPGIAGFRGDNYRTGATYGSVNVVNKTLTEVWRQEISEMDKGSSGKWTGVGWTGQPLMVQWDEETKAIMNLYPAKKAKKDLVEVIYATLDGHIYFLDLETGDYTRDPLFVGMTFKGSGALDPRGYPILYVGSGDRAKQPNGTKKEPRMFIISLIDCSIMYEYGHTQEINIRSWRAFDSSPLVDAETDTLIWPGENGLIYTFKLNTNYNKAAGTLSIDPEIPTINRYMTDLNKDDPGNNLGFEASSIIVENYLYIGDNRGIFFCIDINTMQLVWAQEILDDLNATPVFEWGEDGQGYLYLGTSMEYEKDEDGEFGSTHIYKLNAANGQIVWHKTYDNVYYDKDVSGGVLSSPLLGKKGTALEGKIFFHIAKTPGEYNGLMVALDTKTGEEIWTKAMDHYCWSSPVAVYSDDGKAYIVQFDSGGYGLLIDPANGLVLNKIPVGVNVEASPAVFNDMIVVGTRGKRIYGIKIS